MRHQENHPTGCWWGVKPSGQCSLISKGDGHPIVRIGDDCQHRGGWELGWRGKAKITEPLINVVIWNKPKMLRVSARGQRLEPKGKGSGIGVPISPIADEVPPANRRSLNHAVDAVTELGKPVVFPPGKRAARDADRAAGKG
jgi:hypothetical protein